MDNPQHDKVFIVTFLGVLGVLGAFTVAIIVLANLLDETALPDATQRAQIEERIRPTAQVITDSAALLKVTAAAASARAPMSAADVVAKVCAACHQSGVLQAPKVGDTAEWNRRKAALGGIAGLTKSAIAGKNAMPPRGGDPQLTDAEVKAAVELLLKPAGA